MTTITTPSSVALMPGLEAAWHDVDISFDRFCLVAGVGPWNRFCARMRSV